VSNLELGPDPRLGAIFRIASGKIAAPSSGGLGTLNASQRTDFSISKADVIDAEASDIVQQPGVSENQIAPE
jgi:hypothetical protein